MKRSQPEAGRVRRRLSGPGRRTSRGRKVSFTRSNFRNGQRL